MRVVFGATVIRFGARRVAPLALSWALVSCSALPTVDGPPVLGDTYMQRLPVDRQTARVRGFLDGKDGVRPGGPYSDLYSFAGREGEQVDISLTSDDIDCYLQLYDAGGALIAEDDDGGGWLDSHLVTVLPTDGTYLVAASAYSSTDQGPYDLTVERSMGTPRYPLLEVPARRQAQFTSRDPRVADVPFRAYAVVLEAGAPVTIAMSASGADSFLYVYDGLGVELASDDDSGDGLDSAIHFLPPQSGTYYVVATLYSGWYSDDPAVFELSIEPTW